MRKEQYVAVIGFLLCTFHFNLVRLSFVRNDKGGYENVVIAIAEDLQATTATDGDCQLLLLTTLKSFLNVSSQRLFEATRETFYFRSISVLLPHEWDVPFSGATFETHVEADIRMQESRDGTRVYVQQSRGCGQPGDFIRISPQLLQQWKKEKDGDDVIVNQFVRAWAQYRYGVFEELSRETPHNDSLLPFYHGSNGPTVTGCSSPYPWIFKSCSLADNDETTCTFERNTSITVLSSSIMGELKAKSFCGKEDHYDEAPTTHNALCRESSTWDVIQEHEDYTNLHGESVTFDTPAISVVRARTLPTVLVVDTALCNNDTAIFAIMASMHEQFSKALRIGIVVVNSKKIDIGPINKGQLATALTKSCLSALLANDSVDLAGGLKLGMQMLNNESSSGDIILLASGPPLASIRELPQLAKVKDGLIRYHVINYPPIVTNPTETGIFARAFTWFNIPETDGSCDLNARSRTVEAFQAITEKYNLRFDGSKRMIHRASHSGIAAVGSFTLNPTEIGKKLFFQVFYCLRNDIPIAFVNGHELNVPNILFENALLLIQLNDTEKVENTYKIQFQQNQTRSQVLIWLDEGPSTVKLKGQVAFTEIQQFKAIDPQKLTSLVVLRAHLSLGTEPILNAIVSAIVSGPGGEESTVNLRDSGNGDPDIHENDGVYSSYFIAYASRPAWYSLQFRAVNHGTATLPSSGAVVPEFNISVSAADFYSTTTAESVAHFPPNRITDLSAMRSSSGASNVTLHWMAPGGDLDHGTATGYRLQCNTVREALRDPNGYSERLKEAPNPLEAGARECVRVNPEDYVPDSAEPGAVYFCALVAEDGVNTNQPSNVVTITAKTDETTAMLSTSTASDPTAADASTSLNFTAASTANSSSSTNANITSSSENENGKLKTNEIIIIGCFSGLILLVTIIVLVLCVMNRCRAKHAAPPKSQSPRRRRSSRYNVDIVRSNQRPESFAREDENDPDFHASVAPRAPVALPRPRNPLGRPLQFHAGHTPGSEEDSECSSVAAARPSEEPSYSSFDTQVSPPESVRRDTVRNGQVSPPSHPPRPVQVAPPVPPRQPPWPTSPNSHQPPKPRSYYMEPSDSSVTFLLPDAMASSSSSSPRNEALTLDENRRPPKRSLSGVPVMGTLV